jgi:hypothetical protein
VVWQGWGGCRSIRNTLFWDNAGCSFFRMERQVLSWPVGDLLEHSYCKNSKLGALEFQLFSFEEETNFE